MHHRSSPQGFEEDGRVFQPLVILLLVNIEIMSKESSSKSYREVSRMLAIGDECFEDEVRRLVSTYLVNTCTDFNVISKHEIVNLDLDLDYFTLQGISTQHLNPMQVLTAIQSAQLQMGYEFY